MEQAKESWWRRFADSFVKFSVKLGQEVHLMSLRDAFGTEMPIFITTGIATLLNSVVFPFIIKDPRFRIKLATIAATSRK